MMSKTSSNKIRSILIAAVLMASVFAFSTSFKLAAAQMCGDTITQSVKLTADIGTCSGDGIIVGADKITLDCAGHIVTGSGVGVGVGIDLTGRTGVTVKNCQVTGFEYGFQLESSSNNKLEGNTATGKNGLGFFLLSSSNNKLEGNTATGNGGGFALGSSSNNKLEGNTATGDGSDGFILKSSSNNKLEGNTATGNGLNGFDLDSSSNNKLDENKADNNGGFGYIDVTTGTATAGTANMYEDNECSGNTAGGSSPTGLCSPQA